MLDLQSLWSGSLANELGVIQEEKLVGIRILRCFADVVAIWDSAGCRELVIWKDWHCTILLQALYVDVLMTYFIYKTDIKQVCKYEPTVCLTELLNYFRSTYSGCLCFEQDPNSWIWYEWLSCFARFCYGLWWQTWQWKWCVCLWLNLLNNYWDDKDEYYQNYEDADDFADPPPFSLPDALNTYHESPQPSVESDNENFWSGTEFEDSDEDEFDNGWSKSNSAVETAFGWSIAYGDLMDDGRDLAAEELLGEDFEREAADSGVFLIPWHILYNWLI